MVLMAVRDRERTRLKAKICTRLRDVEGVIFEDLRTQTAFPSFGLRLFNPVGCGPYSLRVTERLGRLAGSYNVYMRSFPTTVVIEEADHDICSIDGIS